MRRREVVARGVAAFVGSLALVYGLWAAYYGAREVWFNGDRAALGAGLVFLALGAWAYRWAWRVYQPVNEAAREARRPEGGP